MKRRAFAAASVLFALAFGHAPRAHAQESPAKSSTSERADALFEKGKADMSAGRNASACAAFAESQDLDPQEGTLLALGLCREQEGKLLRAFAALRDVSASATRSARDDRLRVARAALARITPKIGRVVVRAPKANACSSLRLDADVLARADVEREVPVEPGSHRVVCVRPSGSEWTSDVAVTAGATAIVVPPEPSSNDIGAPAPRPTETTTPSGGLSPLWGWGFGAAGLVTLGIGGFFGIRAFDKWSDVEDRCEPRACRDRTALDDASDARTAATVSNITLVAGAVLLAAGIYILVAKPGGSAARPTTTALVHF